MKRLIAGVVFIAVARVMILAQGRGVQIDGKEVAQNDDVVFRRTLLDWHRSRDGQ